MTKKKKKTHFFCSCLLAALMNLPFFACDEYVEELYFYSHRDESIRFALKKNS